MKNDRERARAPARARFFLEKAFIKIGFKAEKVYNETSKNNQIKKRLEV